MFELRRIWDILEYLYSTLSEALWYEASVLGFWTSHSEWIYFANVQRIGFSLFELKWSNLRELELRRIWDIVGYLYSTERLRVYCDILRTKLWGRLCNGVRKTLWERRYENDAVRKTLWERHRKKDISFDLLLSIEFVIKNVLQRLWALHLWCIWYSLYMLIMM